MAVTASVVGVRLVLDHRKSLSAAVFFDDGSLPAILLVLGNTGTRRQQIKPRNHATACG